jgi:HSP20 family molecular chaperone IbpA
MQSNSSLSSQASGSSSLRKAPAPEAPFSLEACFTPYEDPFSALPQLAQMLEALMPVLLQNQLGGGAQPQQSQQSQQPQQAQHAQALAQKAQTQGLALQQHQHLRIAADIKEREGHWEVTAEFAGMSRSDICLEVDSAKSTIYLSAERAAEAGGPAAPHAQAQAQMHAHRLERWTGKAARSFRVPKTFGEWRGGGVLRGP